MEVRDDSDVCYESHFHTRSTCVPVCSPVRFLWRHANLSCFRGQNHNFFTRSPVPRMSFPSKQDPNRLETIEPLQEPQLDIRRFLHRHTTETPKSPSGTRAAYHTPHNELGMHFLDRPVQQEGILTSKVDQNGRLTPTCVRHSHFLKRRPFAEAF